MEHRDQYDPIHLLYTQYLNSIQKYLHVPECQTHILWRQIEVVRCEDTWNRVHCIVTTPFEVSTTVSAIVLAWHMTLSVRWSALNFLYLYLHICRCICKCIYVVGYEMCLYFYIPKYQPLCSQTAPSPLYLWTIPFTLNVSYCQSDIGETGAPPTKVTKSWKPLFNCPISFEIVRTSHW